MAQPVSIRVWRIAAVMFAVAVVIVSSWPGVKLPNLGEGDLDKLLHLTQYAVLGFLAARGWGPQRTAGVSPWVTWVPALFLIIFAAADETHQRWIPGRDAEVGDWIADVLGIAIGYFVGIVMNRRGAIRPMRDTRGNGPVSTLDGSPDRPQ